MSFPPPGKAGKASALGAVGLDKVGQLVHFLAGQLAGGPLGVDGPTPKAGRRPPPPGNTLNPVVSFTRPVRSQSSRPKTGVRTCRCAYRTWQLGPGVYDSAEGGLDLLAQHLLEHVLYKALVDRHERPPHPRRTFSRSDLVNSGWRSARRSSSRKHRCESACSGRAGEHQQLLVLLEGLRQAKNLPGWTRLGTR